MNRFALLLVLSLSACTFTYIPPIPDRAPLEREARFGLRAPSGLEHINDELRLSVAVDEIPEAGWLAVQWFGPQNREVASDSLWLEPTDAGLARDLYLPEDVPLEPGRWRAVVSFGGRIVRQFAVTVEEVPTQTGV